MRVALLAAVVLALASACAKKPAPEPTGRRAAGAACESGDQCVCFACECDGGAKGAMSSCTEGRCLDGQRACEDVCADRKQGVRSFAPDASKCGERGAR